MKLLIANKLGETGLDILRQQRRVAFDYKPAVDENNLIKMIKGYEALVVRSKPLVERETIVAGRNLRVIGRAGIGLDNIDLKTAEELKIEVVNCPDANTVAAAEHAFGLMTAVARNIVIANQSLKSGLWNRKAYVGTELFGKTLGLVGCGRIATHVAKIAHGFQMNVIGYDPFLDLNEMIKRGIQKRENLTEVLRESDIISLHVAKTPQTINLIGPKELAQMKPNAILINCARGGIVNEDALLHALQNEQITGAGIDVWEKEPDTNNPLQQLPNVVATPHLGASTKEAQERVSQEIIRKVLKKLIA